MSFWRVSILRIKTNDDPCSSPETRLHTPYRRHQWNYPLPPPRQIASNVYSVSMSGHHHVCIHVILFILGLSILYNNTSRWCKPAEKEIALSHWDSRQHNGEWRGELTGHPGSIVIPNKPLFDTLVPKLMNHQNLCNRADALNEYWKEDSLGKLHAENKTTEMISLVFIR